MPRDVVQGGRVYRYVGSLRGVERARAAAVLGAPCPLPAPGRPPGSRPARLLCGCLDVAEGPSVVRPDGSCAACSP